MLYSDYSDALNFRLFTVARNIALSNKHVMFITEYKRIAMENYFLIKSTYKFLMTRLTSQYLEKYDEALHHLHQPSEIKQYAFDVVTNLAASLKLVTYFDYSFYILGMPIRCGIGFVYFAIRYSGVLVEAQV